MCLLWRVLRPGTFSRINGLGCLCENYQLEGLIFLDLEDHIINDHATHFLSGGSRYFLSLDSLVVFDSFLIEKLDYPAFLRGRGGGGSDPDLVC